MSKVYTFFSSVGNIGLSTTVYALADTLSKHTEAKIAVLNLNAWDDGTDFISEPVFTIDQLKSRLSGRMFHNEEDFVSKFTSIRENLFILSGNRDRRSERLYAIEEVDYLIERSKDIFDVILIDAGCHLDNALTAGAIDKTDELFLVLNQQDKSSKQFNQLYDSILIEYPIVKNEINLIMTNYQNRAYFPDADKISKEIGVPLIAVLPNVENGWLCEIERRWTNLTEDKAFGKQMFSLAEIIVEKADLTLLETDVKKRKVFGIF